MEQALSITPSILDWLPPSFRECYGLLPEDMTVWETYTLRNMESFVAAKKRIVSNSSFHSPHTVHHLKETLRKEELPYTLDMRTFLVEFRRYLPFSLTAAQQKVCDDFCRSFAPETMMNRLVQGDVDSGKTAVAAAALFAVRRASYQGALTVPTEVLARQHYETLCILSAKAEPSLRLGLPAGSTRMWERWVLLGQLKCGEIDLSIGAYALLEGTTVSSALALVVTDEQHRSGVLQREKLASKGQLPHVLVMSTTPIPRTLAVILYGDLDNSMIDVRPAGRSLAKNAVVEKRGRPKVLLHTRREIAVGRQIYTVCPQVGSNPMTDLEDAEEYSAVPRKGFHGETTVGALHGCIKKVERQAVMERFARDEVFILVATTMIEAGADVSNVTTMMVENAERSGPATLHQFRGCVDRGGDQAYCIFVQSKKSKGGTEWLLLLQCNDDGSETAAEDLKHRGPGELSSVVRSGELAFGLGDICNDHSVFQFAKEVADALA